MYKNSTAIGCYANIDASFQMVLGGSPQYLPGYPNIKIPGSYVGIGGVYNPTNGYALDVSGNARITGQISAPGGITGATGSFTYLKFNGNGLDISGNLIINKTIYANGGITGATGSFTYLQGLTGSFRYLSGYTGAFQNLTVGNIFANYIDVSGNLQIYNVPGITDSLQVYRSDSSLDPTGTYLFYNTSGSLGNYSQNPSSVLWQIDNSGNSYLKGITGATGSFTYLTTSQDASINGINVGLGGGQNIYNTAVGYNALIANTDTSHSNDAFGFQALTSNTSGYDNTAIGHSALESNTTGNYNVAVGRIALKLNTTGGSNTAIGKSALQNLANGSDNVAIGTIAGINDISGNYNTYLGRSTGQPTTDTNIYTYSTAIGANAVITASNQMMLGGINSSNVYPTVTIPGDLDVSGNAYAYTFTTTSDYRIKENPTPLDDTYIVDKLNPFTYRNKLTGKTDIGLIAHELQDEYPCLVFGEKDAEEYQRVNYSGLIPILIKEVKELKQRVKTLEEERNRV